MTNNNNSAVGFATVDLSNLLIEGQRLAAVRNGMAASLQEAEAKNIRDRRWRIHARRLYEFLAGDRRLKDALVVGSYLQNQPPKFELPFKSAGFRTAFRARNVRGKEKGIDLSVMSVIFSICEQGNAGMDDVTHLGGDQDHVPFVEELVRRGYQVDVIGWLHCTSRALAATASKFVALDPYLDVIGFYQK